MSLKASGRMYSEGVCSTLSGCRVTASSFMGELRALTRALTHLRAVGFQHDSLRRGLALRVRHGVLHLVRRLLVSPAGETETGRCSERKTQED